MRFEGILTPFGGRPRAVEPEIGNEGVFDQFEASLSHEASVKLYLGTEKNPPLVAEGRMTWSVGYSYGIPGYEYVHEAAPELIVGGEDVFALLEDMNGRYVVLVVDELTS